MKLHRDRARRAFAAYAANYNAGDAKVALKISHTYRVAALCERIARSLPLEEPELPAQACRELRDTVSSLRLDNVLAAGFSLSRGRAAEAVEKGAVQVNWTVCQKPDKPVAAGDTITCRGLGKCVLDSVGSPTKKGRLPVVIRRFV